MQRFQKSKFYFFAVLLFSSQTALSIESPNCKSGKTICNPDICRECYCLGPENYLANAPLRPIKCKGDWLILVAPFFWNAHQEGLEFAVLNAVSVPVISPTPPEIEQLNNIVNDDVLLPKSRWDFGLKLGLGYNTACDGWDVGVVWTRFRPLALLEIELDVDDTRSLITLWSDFSPAQGQIDFARAIQASWKVHLNLVDFELGRSFWTGKRLSMHPFIGFRYGDIHQTYKLQQQGGSWSPRTGPVQSPLNNEITNRNDFLGVGLRGGSNAVWNLNCGFGVYGSCALSVLYGRFEVAQKEMNQLGITPFSNTRILETKNHFRSSRAILDLELGVQWSTLFCECRYGFTIKLGWENHLFEHQNQLFRMVRIADVASTDLVNLTGQNVITPQSGSLDAQGFSVAIQFEF